MMTSARRQRRHSLVEMQMGPMIDMVFLLLVFFMVSAKPTKPESDIKMTLPGAMSQNDRVELPDEQRIVIQANGEVTLNDTRLGSPEDQKLPALIQVLRRYKEASELSRTRALVTLDPHDAVPHQRVVDVLGACAESGITGVTFASQTSGATP